MSTLRSPMVAGVCVCVCGGAGWEGGDGGEAGVVRGPIGGGGNRPRPRCESVAPAPQGGTPAFLSGEQGGEGLARKKRKRRESARVFFCLLCCFMQCSLPPDTAGGGPVSKSMGRRFRGGEAPLSLSLSLMYIDSKSTVSPPSPLFHAVVGVAGGGVTNARCEYAASSTHSTKERPPTIQARTKAAV